MPKFFSGVVFCCLVVLLTAFAVSCGQRSASSDVARADDDDDSASPATDDDASPGGDPEALQQIFEEMNFAKYIGYKPTRTTQGPDGYTYYHFSPDDMQCTYGAEMKVAVHLGTENKVMLFMEGGGATWPGGGLAVPIDYPWNLGFKSFAKENPLRNWSFIYVPHCDHSIHSGDSDKFYDGCLHHHHGLRQVGAAVTLMLKLFPNPEKILVAGSSAGGYGTYMAWGLVKSQYMETPTYVMNDSGTGFWDPDKPATWDLIRDTWNIHVPTECTKCQGTVMTYIYELYLKYDPQVRIGMFSSYRDFIISGWFLSMNPDDFQITMLDITDEINADYPDRFKRFLIDGSSHTTYEFILPQGPNYKIRGKSLYEWIGELVDEDPAWDDRLE